MKPLRMRLQAFGPYSRHALIEFKDLTSGGLFLIHGQTGAGKTSLLDGLCFALFGTASGDDRDGEGMRCDLAPIDIATEVSLEFALGARVYRVVRKPRQELKKARGTGTKVSEPTAELYEFETSGETSEAFALDIKTLDLDQASWKPLTSNVSKTSEKVRELLGMDDRQFRQVVVLPQGQFRRFLASGSSEREKILETLFRTRRFREVTENLAKKSEALERELREKRKLLEGQLVTLAALSEEEIEARLAEHETRSRELQTLRSSIEARHRAASQAFEQAKNTARLHRDLAESEKRRVELDARKDRISEGRQALERHRKAQPVLQLHLQSRKNREETELLRQQIEAEDQKQKAAEARLQELEARRTPLLAREPEIANAQNEIQVLRDQLGKAEKLLAAKKTLTKLETQLQTVRASITLSDQRMTEMKARHLELNSELASTSALALSAESLRAKRELLLRESASAKDASTRVERLLRLRSEIEGRKAKLPARLALVEQNRESLTKLKIQFHLNQAAQLALELKAGAPCAVCGSTDHPQKARMPENAPDRAQIETAEKTLSKNEHALVEARTQIEAMLRDEAQQVAELQKIYPHVKESEALLKEPLEQLRTIEIEIEKKNSELNACSAAEEKCQDFKAQLASLEKQISQTEQERKNLQSQSEDARVNLEARKASIDELEAAVPEENRDPALIITRGKALREKIDAFQKELQDLNLSTEEERARATTAKAKHETLSQELDKKTIERTRLHSDLDQALQTAGFSQIDQAISAHLDASQATRWEQEIRGFENEWAIVTSRVRELTLEIEKLPHSSADLNATEADFQKADQEKTAWLTETAELQARLHDLKLARQKLSEIGGEIRSLEERYKVVGRLAKVAAGQPPYNLTGVNFQRYVLAAQLDDVLEQASRRLLVMSRGQFNLRRVRGREDKRMSAGLDLEVEDSFTGTCRSTASLSGGEGFLASLALALGLADVVQSHLGGVRLDAVFIDEGFGTLDPESLDLAMRTLAELQAGGRLVGIISHVPELKEQIAHRLFVRKTPSGSEITWEPA